jgi:glycosyltransferase involved in cell wall biosynthesis
MRILLHAGVDLSLPGGVETHVIELGRGLIARGHTVEIVGRPDPFPPFRMVSAVDPSSYDIVHHHGGNWPRGVAPGPHHVRTFHFSVAARMTAYLGIGRLRTLVNPGNYSALLEERAATRRPGGKIAVSEKLKGELARHHGLDPARVHVIPNGSRFLAPVELRAALRARHGIAEGTPVLLTIGRDDYVKGYDLLARAWTGSSVERAGALWVSVGGRAPGRRGGRMWTGPLAPQQVADWIHAADVGAFPSYYEGGGIALLDMLAGGLYALAHDVGIASEVVRPGQNGEIVPRSLDAWIAALPRALGRAPARAPAPGLGDEYRWDAIVARVERVYLETLAAAG